MKFQLFTRRKLLSRRPLHYFRLVATNGRVVAQSEGYYNASERLQTVLLIKRTCSQATIEDLGEDAP